MSYFAHLKLEIVVVVVVDVVGMKDFVVLDTVIDDDEV